MVLSEHAVRKWKLAGGVFTSAVAFTTVFVVDYSKPVTSHDIESGKGTMKDRPHVFSDLQQWFWGAVDSKLGIPRQSKDENERAK